MKFIPLRRKRETVPTGVQVQSTISNYKHNLSLMGIAAFVIAAGNNAVAQVTTASSPLEILQQAPKVRLHDPTPTPVPTPTPAPTLTPNPQEPVPYRPPAGPAPVIEPVYPAITPYAGNSVSGRVTPDAESYYGAPSPGSAPAIPANTPPRYISPGPTPRPVLGPEDMEPKKKRGFVRGLINAIPFVGDDDEPENTVQTPRPGQLEPEPDAPTYRAYDTAPSQNSTDTPILLPPGTAAVQGYISADPEPSSPPIMTPEPRRGVPVREFNGWERPADADAADVPSPQEPASSRALLTVKRESDSVETTIGAKQDFRATVEPEPAAGAISKEPARADNVEATPRPLEQATTSVLIQDADARGPEDDTLGPRPDASATPLEPFDPTRPKPEPVTEDVASSLTIEQADLGMPNPTYEQNTHILGEFQEAVRKARAEDYAAAAQMFREYGQNHPSSGLAPRAYFLSIIFERNRAQARENVEAMNRLFPESRYVKDIAKRRPDVVGTSAIASETSVVPNETPRQKVERLERELTVAVGDPAREPVLRKDLGVAYLELEDYNRAYEVLLPALDMSRGQPVEAEVLLAMGRVLVVRRETVQAISLFEAVEDKNPDLIYKDAPSAWNVGLAFEGVGRYSKARTIYNAIRQRWPATAEAGWAASRLNELAALAQ